MVAKEKKNEEEKASNQKEIGTSEARPPNKILKVKKKANNIISMRYIFLRK